jgi:hypothetical protein
MATSSAWYTDVHTSKHFPLGTIKQAVSGNRYIYGKGVASLAANDGVMIDEVGVTTRAVTGASLVGRFCVAQAANTSTSNYSWYLASGTGPCAAATTVSDNKGLYLTSTAGQVDDGTAGAETFIYGAFSRSDATAVANQITIEIVGAAYVTNEPLD